ncbi:MAG: hydrogenase expression/formation protein HypE [Deltaproteobacteria bacterium]|nr:hydrogenase expression/formation protein HypE [Deltaproteobacteria bacterium]
MTDKVPSAGSCPIDAPRDEVVVLGHGSGGRLTADLVNRVFLPALSNPILDRLEDGAGISLSGTRIVFSTDAFVVKPLRFPGGDIGSLAVNGTINDLAVMGGQPVGLSAAFILEEGFAIEDLRDFTRSMRAAADRAGVAIVAADTKVVDHGKADGLYIATSGIGVVPDKLCLGPEQIKPGDALLVSGPLGDHGIAVMSAREGFEFQTALVSDSAPLNGLVSSMLASGGRIRCMRDPTRGGVATILNELARSGVAEIVVEDARVPVRDAVRAACEILGLDPLYVACEGTIVAIVADEDEGRVLGAMREHPLGAHACRIGTVTATGKARVLLHTALGTTRYLEQLSGSQLPRIC